jgi:hypothetical protein
MRSGSWSHAHPRLHDYRRPKSMVRGFTRHLSRRDVGEISQGNAVQHASLRSQSIPRARYGHFRVPRSSHSRRRPSFAPLRFPDAAGASGLYSEAQLEKCAPQKSFGFKAPVQNKGLFFQNFGYPNTSGILRQSTPTVGLKVSHFRQLPTNGLPKHSLWLPYPGAQALSTSPNSCDNYKRRNVIYSDT